MKKYTLEEIAKVVNKIKAITDKPGVHNRYTVYLRGEKREYISMSDYPESLFETLLFDGVKYGTGAAEHDPADEITLEELPENVMIFVLKYLKKRVEREAWFRRFY